MQMAKEYLANVHRLIVAEGIPCETTLATGDPASQILALVEQSAAPIDLIALATRARSEIERILDGSVSSQILRHAHRPILILHPQG